MPRLSFRWLYCTGERVTMWSLSLSLPLSRFVCLSLPACMPASLHASLLCGCSSSRDPFFYIFYQVFRMNLIESFTCSQVLGIPNIST